MQVGNPPGTFALAVISPIAFMSECDYPFIQVLARNRNATITRTAGMGHLYHRAYDFDKGDLPTGSEQFFNRFQTDSLFQMYLELNSSALFADRVCLQSFPLIC